MFESRDRGIDGEAGTDLGLGDSISGTCKKLELFLTCDRDGEWRVGAGRARSSATGT